MSRRLRSYLPGAPFHITARLNNREMWLADDSSKDFALEVIAESMCKSDALLIAFAIMTNHLHLIIRRGRAQLAQLMQPVLCRIAMHLRRKLKRTGHIFETPYFDVPCADPEYLRTMIVYTHLNPYRAGLCDQLSDYPWTSHAHYSGGRLYGCVPITHCLEAFAAQDDDTPAQWRENYLRHVEAQIMRDSCDESDAAQGVVAPSACAGDRYWAREFMRRQPALVRAAVQPSADLRDIVRRVLAEYAPDTTLDELCELRYDRSFVDLRRKIISRATLAGYRRSEIARFLHVSDSLVSKVASTIEQRPPTEYGPRRAVSLVRLLAAE